MAKQINPTRLELSRLKKRLETAARGHKLLKDKRDEMTRQFIEMAKKNRALRATVEEKIIDAQRHATLASAQDSPQSVKEALFYPARQPEFETGVKQVMGVEVPTFSYTEFRGDVDLPYGFAYSSTELDVAVLGLTEILPELIELAEVEKTCNRLAEEVEQTRRRVNALEFVVIPQLKEQIRSITMKLEENERSAQVRLMKAKEVIEANRGDGGL